MSPRVSVVMPAYDAEWTIAAAASSVLWQTYRDLELVVVDDGSRDATGSIVAALPGPVRIVRQENAGVAAARNRGIQESSGDLIAFCDADDILFEGHLAALLDVFEANGGIATANSYWLFQEGIHPTRQRYKGRFPPPVLQRQAILEHNFVSTLSLFDRRLVEKIGGFAPKRRAEDWDFWLRAIYHGERVFLQRKPLALYRWGTSGLSADWESMDQEIEAIFDGLEERVALTAAELAYVLRRRAGPGPRRLGRRGDEALRAGRYAEAARNYRRAADLCPSERPLVWKARAMRFPRLAGPLVRRRQLRIEREVGFESRHTR